MRTTRAWTGWTAAAAIAVTLAGCSGKGSSPTSTTTYGIVVSAVMLNTATAATILDGQMLFDGTLAIDLPVTTATNLETFTASGNVATGSLTLAFVVQTQTSSPSSYTVVAPDIQIYDANGFLVNELRLATQQASLANGQSINYTFSF